MIDDPQFGAADVAAILQEPEATIRRWHHAGFSGYFGRKDGHAVGYSAREIAGFAVARDLVRMKFPPMLAARIGATVTASNPKPDAKLSGTPAEIAMTSPDAGSGVMADRTAWRVPGHTTSTITVPVGRIFADVVEKASCIRREAAQPTP